MCFLCMNRNFLFLCLWNVDVMNLCGGCMMNGSIFFGVMLVVMFLKWCVWWLVVVFIVVCLLVCVIVISLWLWFFENSCLMLMFSVFDSFSVIVIDGMFRLCLIFDR